MVLPSTLFWFSVLSAFCPLSALLKTSQPLSSGKCCYSFDYKQISSLLFHKIHQWHWVHWSHFNYRCLSITLIPLVHNFVKSCYVSLSFVFTDVTINDLLTHSARLTTILTQRSDSLLFSTGVLVLIIPPLLLLRILGLQTGSTSHLPTAISGSLITFSMGSVRKITANPLSNTSDFFGEKT